MHFTNCEGVCLVRVQMLVGGFKGSQRCGTCCTPTRIGMDLSSSPENRVAADRKDHARIVTPSCGLSFPTFAVLSAFSELLLQVLSFWLRQVFSPSPRQAFSLWLRQVFSLWPRFQLAPAIPAWAVSECDGGHVAAAGCAQLLPPSAAECLHGFGARPRGIRESF